MLQNSRGGRRRKHRYNGPAILESQGYEVLCAANGFDGLTKLKQLPPDVIISDLQMPDMSGVEFLTFVRKCFPDIPTIAISSATNVSV
jgi:CheY-like chemotaxis protein